MKKALFIVDNSTKFRILIQIANLLFDNGIKPSFYFDSLLHNVDKEKVTCGQLNYEIFQSYRLNQNYGDLASDYANFTDKFKLLVIRILARIFKVFKSVASYKYQEIIIRHFFIKNKFDYVVCSEDNAGIESLIIPVANKMNITTCVFPFTLANKEEFIFTIKSRNIDTVNSYLQKRYFCSNSEWLLQSDGQIFSFYELSDIIAKKLCGIAPKFPYLPVGGFAKVKFFESKFMYNYYLQSGYINNDDIVIAGNSAFDRFFNSQNEQNSKKYILCSLPPDFYSNNNYTSYNEMLKHWIDTMAKNNLYDVVLSLHPRINKQDIPVINYSNVFIADKPIEELIPGAIVFVACISATIRFALLCKVKTLNFDVFEMNYTEYEKENDVITVKEKVSFEKRFAELLSKPEFSRNDDYYGPTDGISGKRIINKLLSKQ